MDDGTVVRADDGSVLRTDDGSVLRTVNRADAGEYPYTVTVDSGRSPLAEKPSRRRYSALLRATSPPGPDRSSTRVARGEVKPGNAPREQTASDILQPAGRIRNFGIRH